MTKFKKYELVKFKIVSWQSWYHIGFFSRYDEEKEIYYVIDTVYDVDVSSTKQATRFYEIEAVELYPFDINILNVE